MMLERWQVTEQNLMPGEIGKMIRKYFPFLFAEAMPVWLTILTGISVAVGTYLIAPSINRQFELDSARSAQLTKSIDGLNGEIIDLSMKVRRLNSALVNGDSDVPEVRDEALDLVTKLQWRLVDLRVVLKTPEDREAVKRLATKLRAVQAALLTARDAKAQASILIAMRELAVEVRLVLARLYATAKLT